ncbi:MAG: HupE/UreJ family protein [Minwuia sp.]|uniref:HupE/UreJ family protein n=1 Tax=Minwuia sp. TaxID=2493630 RepID=UPI003A8659A0
MGFLTLPGVRRFIAACLLLLVSLPAAAHEIKPSVFEVVLGKDGTFTIAAEVNAEAMLVDIGPGYDDTNDSPQAEAYDRVRALPPAAFADAFREGEATVLDGFDLQFDGQTVRPRLVSIEVRPAEDISVTRVSDVRLDGPILPGAETFTFSYPRAYGAIALKMKREGDAEFRTHWMPDGTETQSLPLEGLVPPRTWYEVIGEYIYVGFVHIVPKGLDHILFVLGLFLLSRNMRPLLVQVTTFTVAHSITLALSLYGIVELPPAIVEPLIALSIAYVAIENIFMARLSPWRPFVVFAFGLLHGLGFAGVLTELGLPRSEFLEALIGFNIGVEAGQLAVILAALLAVGIWGLPERLYRRAIVIPASLAIAFVGLYWTVERVGLL